MREDYPFILFGDFIAAVANHSHMQLWICFAEYIEKDSVTGCGGIKGTLYGDYFFVVIFLVVGEYHQLGDIDEFAETLILHPGLDAVFLRHDSLCVIGLFDLDESKRKTIEEASDVGAKVVAGFLVFASEFSGDMPLVVSRVLKINELDSADG